MPQSGPNMSTTWICRPRICEMDDNYFTAGILRAKQRVVPATQELPRHTSQTKIALEKEVR